MVTEDLLKKCMSEYVESGRWRGSLTALEGYVNDLVLLTVQDTPHDSSEFDSLVCNIVTEATALVLSGELDKDGDLDDGK